MFSLEELFCCVDDFCQAFEPQWERQLLGNGLQRRRRIRSLCLSEIMTILIGFHQSCYRNFKAYYQELVQCHCQSAFPGLVSYGRFVEWMPSALLPLCAFVRSCFGNCSGISFMDSTSLKVCHNRRISQHKVSLEHCSTRQDLDRLVLWLQAAPSRQRQRRVARASF